MTLTYHSLLLLGAALFSFQASAYEVGVNTHLPANNATDPNPALDRAVEHAVTLKKPLLIIEPVILNYPWANRRLHTFILEGMAENQRRMEDATARYLPFVETEKGQVAALFDYTPGATPAQEAVPDGTGSSCAKGQGHRQPRSGQATSARRSR